MKIKGWIYIIVTVSIKSIKIGFSLKDPILRAQELNNTGNPHSYEVVFKLLTDNPREVEQKVHERFRRYNDGKEWFNVSIDSAIREIKRQCLNPIYYEWSSPKTEYPKHLRKTSWKSRDTDLTTYGEVEKAEKIKAEEETKYKNIMKEIEIFKLSLVNSEATQQEIDEMVNEYQSNLFDSWISEFY